MHPVDKELLDEYQSAVTIESMMPGAYASGNVLNAHMNKCTTFWACCVSGYFATLVLLPALQAPNMVCCSSGDKLAVVGPNGAGKSSLLKIIAGTMDHDNGSLYKNKGATIGYLPQADLNVFKEQGGLAKDMTVLQAVLASDSEMAKAVQVTAMQAGLSFFNMVHRARDTYTIHLA